MRRLYTKTCDWIKVCCVQKAQTITWGKLVTFIIIISFLGAGSRSTLAEDVTLTPTTTVATATTPPPPRTKSSSGTPAVPPAGPTATPKPKATATPIGTVQPGQQAATGIFFILWGNPTPGSSIILPNLYFLSDVSGQSLPLVLDENLVKPLGGVVALNRKMVNLTGTRASLPPGITGPAPLVVQSVQLNSQPIGNPDGIEPLVAGSKPYINIMCKFPDNAGDLNSQSYFEGLTGDSYPGAGHYWRESSYNNINLLGSGTAGWFTLPHPQTYYAPTPGSGFNADKAKLAEDCAKLADPYINFNNFYGINLMFNGLLDAGAWGGSSYITLDGVSAVRPTTWMPPWGWKNLTVVGHEVGHSFGLPHSASNTGVEYNNPWDVMGDGWAYCNLLTDPTYGCLGQHTISYHKDQLGWIPAAQKYLAIGGRSQTITLERLAQPTNTNYLMAQIPINGSNTRFYTVEARRRIGNDQKLPGDAVIIHSVDTTRSLPAWVQDEDNNGNTGDAGSMWTVGETFSDATNSISVTVNSITATGYVVTIDSPFLGTDLTINGPSVTGNIASAGEEDWYRFTVSNSAANIMVETQSGTLSDNYMYFYGPDSPTTLIAQDDDSGVGLSAKITRFLNPGIYYVRVRAFSSSATGNYTIRALTLGVGQGSNYSQNYIDAYNRRGGQPNLGYPSDLVRSYSSNSGVYWQPLSGGAAGAGGIFHHQVAGSDPAKIRAFVISSGTYSYYTGLGGPDSWLGPLTSDEFINSSNEWQANFSNGYVINTTSGIQTYPWPSTFSGWKAQYYNNAELLSGPSFVRNEGDITSLNFDHVEWPTWGQPIPDQGINFATNWSTSWTRTSTFAAGGYRFTLCGDDGVRLYLNGVKVLDEWRVQNYTCFNYPSTGYQTYATDTAVPLKIEYYQGEGGTRVTFAVTKQPAPIAPTTLTATLDVYYNVALNWSDNANDETGYRVERKTGINGTWTEVGIATSSNYYHKTDLTPGSQYFYRVRAYNLAGNSAYSNEASVTIPFTPAPPANLDAKAVAGTQINLSWWDYASNELGFTIERKTGVDGSWVELAVVTTNQATYSDVNVQPATIYYYRIRAYNSAGSSSYSTEEIAYSSIEEWVWRNPQVQGNNLFDISCPGSNICYAVGGAGTILKTTTGGASWVTLLSLSMASLNSISCPSLTTCYVVGGDYFSSGNAVILKTNNGIEWTSQPIPSGMKQISSISCLSESSCYALSDAYPNTTILKTNNGNNWSIQSWSGSMNSISCVDATTCYAIGASGTILKTTDGSNWSSQISGTTNNLTHLKCIVTNNVCYAVGIKGTIVKTSNGSSWTALSSGTDKELRGIACLSATICYVAGGSYATDASLGSVIILKTDDGSNWASQLALDQTPLFNAISCTNLKACYAVGNSGLIFGMTDNVNWNNETSGPRINFNGVSCINTSPMTCYAVGGQGYSNGDASAKGYIYKSTDGGLTWLTQSVPANTYVLADISCINATTCYALGGYISATGSGSVILKTSDGNNWFNQSVPVGISALESLSCISNNICYAVGSPSEAGQAVIKTIDGTSWASQAVPAEVAKGYDIACPNSTTCYAVIGRASGGIGILKWDGSTWAVQAVPSQTFNLRSISCATSTLCYAVGAGSKGGGESGSIARTIDGNTWEAQITGSSSGFSNIKCLSVTTICYAVGSQWNGADVWKTSDGLNWIPQNPNISSFLRGIDCLSPTSCITVGTSGTILSKAFVVYATNDSGNPAQDYSFSYALANATFGQTISLRPGGGILNLSGNAPREITRGVVFRGTCSNGPGIIINGSGLNGPGLRLKGNVQLYGLKIQGFSGLQLKTDGPANRVSCVVVNQP